MQKKRKKKGTRCDFRIGNHLSQTCFALNVWLKKKEKLKSAIPLPQMDKWFLPQGQGSSSWFLPFPTYREVLCI